MFKPVKEHRVNRNRKGCNKHFKDSGRSRARSQWFLPRGVGDTVSDLGILDVERVDQPTKYMYMYILYTDI